MIRAYRDTGQLVSSQPPLLTSLNQHLLEALRAELQRVRERHLAGGQPERKLQRGPSAQHLRGRLGADLCARKGGKIGQRRLIADQAREIILGPSKPQCQVSETARKVAQRHVMPAT